jgi:SWIM zinc finger
VRPVLGTVVALRDLERSELEGHFGESTFKRGASYARNKRVLSLTWDEHEQVLRASVVGHGALYQTVARFNDRGYVPEFIEGECTCPIGYNCKHVAAIVLAAGEPRGAVRPPGASPRPASARHVSSAPQTSAWEQPLRALVEARSRPHVGNPLAIELRLTAPRYPDRRAPRLTARLMRPGARGGWVNGSLDWGALDSWQVRDGEYREDHVALIRELHAVYRLYDGPSSYSWGYRSERTIDLSSCESAQLWRLLEEAARLGLPVIHAHAGRGEIPPPLDGELVLDVTRTEIGDFDVGVVLRVGGVPIEHLVPVRFIGRTAHGIVCAERSDVDAGRDLDSWRLRLVRLSRPAGPQLERMLLSDERLLVPAPEIDRFAHQLCPALRHIAPVSSSDGTFTPPSVSEPALVLQAHHGPDTLLMLGWEWEYTIDSESHRSPESSRKLNSPSSGPRGTRELMGAVAMDEPALQSVGLLDDAGRPVEGPPAILSGLDSLRLTAVLPEPRSDRPGSPRGRSEPTSTALIAFSTACCA